MGHEAVGGLLPKLCIEPGKVGPLYMRTPHMEAFAQVPVLGHRSFRR